jgi:meso-butanediol dehydrogenase / (S,S)-butanediol dehydrogenase / diacetyl reductase
MAVAVVTGAASGMGRATAERLTSHGWSVVAVDVSEAGLAWTDGREGLTPYVGDVATEEGNAGMVATAETSFGGVDGAVLNAAVIEGGSIERLLIEELDRMYAVNLRGVALGIRAVVPALRARGGGAISVAASMSGTTGEEANWAYGATKAGVINLVRGAALDLGRENIRVNALCPGPIRGTGMSARVETDAPEVFARVRAMTALDRWGEPDEVAAVHEFLLSPEASFITGATILVDGGVTAGRTWQR